jgi:hypothetical protein
MRVEITLVRMEITLVRVKTTRMRIKISGIATSGHYSQNSEPNLDCFGLSYVNFTWLVLKSHAAC